VKLSAESLATLFGGNGLMQPSLEGNLPARNRSVMQLVQEVAEDGTNCSHDHSPIDELYN